MLVLSLNFFQKETKGFFYSISAPIQIELWKTGGAISNFFQSIGKAGNLQNENNELQKIIQELLAEKAFLIKIEEENEILREALQIGLEKDFQLAFAQVISQDIGQESIIINQGAKDGLSAGMPVVTEQKVLLGRIGEVFENFSRVILISSKESSFDAKISGADAAGVVKGLGNFKLNFDLVPRDKTLNVGDLVVSSSLGGIYPEGLLAGKIIQISRDDVSPFYQAEVAPFFEIPETSAVFVILNFSDD